MLISCESGRFRDPFHNPAGAKMGARINQMAPKTCIFIYMEAPKFQVDLLTHVGRHLVPSCSTRGIFFNVPPCFQRRPLNRTLQNMAFTRRLNYSRAPKSAKICQHLPQIWQDLRETVRNQKRAYNTPHRNHRLNTKPARHNWPRWLPLGMLQWMKSVLQIRAQASQDAIHLLAVLVKYE